MNALASTTAPYQALVCIYLAGGNDSNNMVIPIATAQQNYGLYAQGRQRLGDPAGLAACRFRTAPKRTACIRSCRRWRRFTLHGNAAILANVGMLVQPTTPAIFQSRTCAQLPSQLFSHSDQASQWQAAIPNGTAVTGWGGRVEDNLLAQYNAARRLLARHIDIRLRSVLHRRSRLSPPPCRWAEPRCCLGATTPSRLTAVQQLMSFDNGLKLVQAANANFNRGVGFSQALERALTTASIKTVFPNTLLGAATTDRGKDDEHPRRAWHRASGVLLPTRWLRYARRASIATGSSAAAVQPGDRPVLSATAGSGHG